MLQRIHCQRELRVMFAYNTGKPICSQKRLQTENLPSGSLAVNVLIKSINYYKLDFCVYLAFAWSIHTNYYKEWCYYNPCQIQWNFT